MRLQRGSAAQRGLSARASPAAWGWWGVSLGGSRLESQHSGSLLPTVLGPLGSWFPPVLTQSSNWSLRGTPGEEQDEFQILPFTKQQPQGSRVASSQG